MSGTDLRIQKTYAALTRAFTDLLKAKSFEQITVKELCDAAIVRTATFYNHFSDKYEFADFVIRDTLQRYHRSDEDLSSLSGQAYYEKLISECGMYLLQNDILYKDSERRIHRITNEELISLSEKEVRDRLRDARIIFFGGLAFSGYNEQFNANNGIYRKTISRDEEIRQSKCFEELYNKVLGILPDRKIVVFTHTPMDCWSEKVNYHKEYVYVSGHTHRNQFYDDGETRIYADNQIGYSNNNPHLKWLEMDNEYDYFADYEDGIHQITADDYRSFYRGKNIMITFNRDVNVLYMLKKNGYYCFIHQSKGGSLTMLNGGALKKLNEWDINYYYDNMDMVVDAIKKPLDKYSGIQEKIAAEIRKLGGDGTIHGCIIDIDWYNHVYVNPVDMKITGYWASDIINKKITCIFSKIT